MILCLCPNPSVDMFIWLDSLGPGQVNHINKEKRFPGGKGIHVALAAAELGEEVKLIGFWGGPTGQWIRNECENLGVSCEGPEIDGWSRTCLSFKSQDKYNDTELLGLGPSINTKDLEKLIETFEKNITKADCVSMSGSWPEGGAKDEYSKLLEKANKAGKMTFLDCAGEQLSHALLKKPFVVHINKTEGEDYFEEKDPGKIALLLSKKCEYAAVTAGAEGLYLASKNKLIHVHCTVENVYSAVGSGDCLLAGLIVAFQRGLNFLEMAQLAVACGGANCIRQDLGMLYQTDVNMLQERVVINEYV
jgi:1-phosphofructokinase family hexose kinase